MEEDPGFCVHCGRKLTAEDAHCPSCGILVEKGDDGQIPYYESPQTGKDYTTLVKVLLGLYLAVVIISVLALFAVGSVLPLGDADADKAVLDALGVSTIDEAKTLMNNMGFFYLGTLILVGISMMYVIRMQKWKPAWLFCGIASVYQLGMLAFGTGANNVAGAVVGMVIGLIVTYLIYESKGRFQDTESYF